MDYWTHLLPSFRAHYARATMPRNGTTFRLVFTASTLTLSMAAMQFRNHGGRFPRTFRSSSLPSSSFGSLASAMSVYPWDFWSRITRRRILFTRHTKTTRRGAFATVSAQWRTKNSNAMSGGEPGRRVRRFRQRRYPPWSGCTFSISGIPLKTTERAAASGVERANRWRVTLQPLWRHIGHNGALQTREIGKNVVD